MAFDDMLEKLIEAYIDPSKADDFNFDSVRDRLQMQLQSEEHGCLVCLESIERQQAVWSCRVCYETYHLTCIQQWATQQIQMAYLEQCDTPNTDLNVIWHCAKCRHAYDRCDRPTQYECFCGKEVNPKPDRWSIPHSCDQICDRELSCNHRCKLRCHPGPCPACPVIVKTSCHCGKAPLTARRCVYKKWSCNQKCGCLLGCGKHRCEEACHAGECPPCNRSATFKCRCGNKSEQRRCIDRDFSCGRVCRMNLSCGNHSCETVCHNGDCQPCVRPGTDTCPCGKQKYTDVHCINDVPCCFDSCGKTLPCGHECVEKCHRGDCPPCMISILKPCRCGVKKLSTVCSQMRLCDIKCRKKRQCGRHACNRKCCDGNCPPCEQICSSTLNCGNHKCQSPCHSGQCYPCALMAEVVCPCGGTKLIVPCGRRNKVIVPCKKACPKPSQCHHVKKPDHPCHKGDCPDCPLSCHLPYKTCCHKCLSRCHDHVLRDINAAQNSKATGFWDRKKEDYHYVKLPCPPCKTLVDVYCIGEHDTMPMPCSEQKKVSCGRICGFPLSCGNHTCSMKCHSKEVPHENCLNPCSLPAQCQHECPRECHPPPCAPCRLMVQAQCHCTINTILIPCFIFRTMSDEVKQLRLSCGNQCPKKMPCGHQCILNCHVGSCSSSQNCKKKERVACVCGRKWVKMQCHEIAKGAKIECDADCAANILQLEAEKMKEKRNHECRNTPTDSQPKPKKTQRKRKMNETQQSLLLQYNIYIIGAIIAILLSILSYILIYY